MAITAAPITGHVHQETRVTTFNGFAWLAIGLGLMAYSLYVFGSAIVAYDEDDSHAAASREPTLLASADIVVKALVRELQARFDKAGVVVEEARLTHLAYAPEIAQVMLRRQQAEAIISARSKIVTGAVSMVEMALNELSAKKVVELDDERKASMVSNLMTVLCAESDVQPVINTGTLYN